MTDPLEPGWLLHAGERRRRPNMTGQEAVELLEALSDDPLAGPAARSALELVQTRGADARLLALTLEAVMSDVDLGPGKGGSSRRRRVD